MMPSPEERIEMLSRTRRLVQERQIFLADFWNSGLASNGCICAGRPKGYFFIDWNGDAMPCVFIPYAADNMYDVYERGDDISAVLKSPFFSRIRNWQDRHGFATSAENVKNWLAPCPIRDHFGFMKSAISETAPRPVNKDAEDAASDEAFHSGMLKYGKRIHELTRPIWLKKYADSAHENERVTSSQDA